MLIEKTFSFAPFEQFQVILFIISFWGDRSRRAVRAGHSFRKSAFAGGRDLPMSRRAPSLASAIKHIVLRPRIRLRNSSFIETVSLLSRNRFTKAIKSHLALTDKIHSYVVHLRQVIMNNFIL